MRQRFCKLVKKWLSYGQKRAKFSQIWLTFTAYRVVGGKCAVIFKTVAPRATSSLVIRHNCHVSTWVSTRISTWKSRRSVNERLLTTVLCAAHWHVHLGRWQAFTCFNI
eukprot:sb/3477376/